ncbi:MAG: hypothetical protein IT289_00545 [Oligoflexia bacterium]|nr:hypothetical protein [Oligoflexia bacterium]
MDFLNGDLDRIFTALYELGHIDPMLIKDWKPVIQKSQNNWTEVRESIHVLNKLKSISEIRDFLNDLPQDHIEAIVIEVARELVDAQDAKAGSHTVH